MENPRVWIGAASALLWIIAVFSPETPGLRQALGTVCHQLPGRGLFLDSANVLCARCLGLWLGAACAALLLVSMAGRWPAIVLFANLLLSIAGIDAPQLRFILGFLLASTTVLWALPLVDSPWTVRQTDSRA